jgi:hypothetical protein
MNPKRSLTGFSVNGRNKVAAEVGPGTRENHWIGQCQAFLRPSLGPDALEEPVRVYGVLLCTLGRAVHYFFIAHYVHNRRRIILSHFTNYHFLIDSFVSSPDRKKSFPDHHYFYTRY